MVKMPSHSKPVDITQKRQRWEKIVTNSVRQGGGDGQVKDSLLEVFKILEDPKEREKSDTGSEAYRRQVEEEVLRKTE